MLSEQEIDRVLTKIHLNYNNHHYMTTLSDLDAYLIQAKAKDDFDHTKLIQIISKELEKEFLFKYIDSDPFIGPYFTINGKLGESRHGLISKKEDPEPAKCGFKEP